jgi:hypothetical protein
MTQPSDKPRGMRGIKKNYLFLLMKALSLRLLPDRPQGVTPYYRESIRERLAAAEAQLRHHGSTTHLLDLGCGRDLHLGLTAAVRFGKRVTAFDVTPLREMELVNFTLNHLGAQPIHAWGELENRYGLRYVVAPVIDAAAGGCDGAASTAVFEHIPFTKLRRVISVLAKTLPLGAVVTAEIDYRDHWSFLTPVPPDHFYGLSETAFALINPPRMYQNRVRHPEILRWFSEAGFSVIDEQLDSLPLTIPRANYGKKFYNQPRSALEIGIARTTWCRDIEQILCASR